MDSHKLKGLFTNYEKTKEEKQVALDNLKRAQRIYEEKESSLKRLEKEIHKLNKRKGLIVSEHALLRYLERVTGIDLDMIRNEIASKEIVELAERFGGNGKFFTKSYAVIIENNVVTTITLK